MHEGFIRKKFDADLQQNFSLKLRMKILRILALLMLTKNEVNAGLTTIDRFYAMATYIQQPYIRNSATGRKFAELCRTSVEERRVLPRGLRRLMKRC